MHNKVKKRMYLTFYLVMHVNMKLLVQFEGVSDVSSEDVPTFDFEIKGALEVRSELHLKVHTLMHLLVQKSAQKGTFDVAVDGTLDCAMKGAPANLRFDSLSIVFTLNSTQQIELLTFLN